MKDYYAILGVNSLAPSADIRRAYRMLALTYHPDRNRSAGAESMFKEINEAYEILGDPTARRRYDLQRAGLYASETIDNVTPSRASTHRDPAYRRRSSAPPPKSDKRLRYEFMGRCLPYIKWLTPAGLVAMVVFALDFCLPPIPATETVLKRYVNNRQSSIVVTTTHRHSMRIYYDGAFLRPGTLVNIEYSPLLRVVFKMSDANNPRRVATSSGVYGPVFIFPFFLFSTAIAGFYLRRNVEQYFNINVAIGILFILVIYFTLSA